MSSRRFTRKRPLAVGLVAAALVALAVGVAGAHKQTSKTRTTFTATIQDNSMGPSSHVYEGRVTATDHNTRCVRSRKVTVTHEGFVLGTDLTSDGGRWKIVSTPPSDPTAPKGDEVVATVARRFARNNIKHKHICSVATATTKAP